MMATTTSTTTTATTTTATTTTATTTTATTTFRGRSRRLAAAVVAGAALSCVTVVAPVAGAVVGSGSAAAGDSANGDGARRILVIALPYVTWAHVQESDVPNLRALLSESGVASLAVRVDRLATRPGEGYTTIGAGTRAVADPREAGLALQPDEVIENGTAADVFRRRSGHALDGAVGQMWIGSILDENEAALFGGVPGVLGDALVADGRRATGETPTAGFVCEHEGVTSEYPSGVTAGYLSVSRRDTSAVTLEYPTGVTPKYPSRTPLRRATRRHMPVACECSISSE